MNDTELDRLLDEWHIPAPAPSLRRQLGAAFPADPRRRLFGVPVRWILAFAASAGAVAIGTGLVGDGAIGTNWCSADLPGGRLYVQITQMVDPPVAALQWFSKGSSFSGGSRAGALSGSSALHDRSARLFYGYEYLAEPLGGGQYRVTISPLEMPDIQKGPFVVSAGLAPLPAIPTPRVVGDGEPFDIDLYRSGSVRVFSRLQLSVQPFPRRPQKPSREQQRATLHMDGPKLYRNGELVASRAAGSSSGATLWFRLPGLGRYLLALDPSQNPAFVEAGEVNGSALAFQSGGDQYRIECDKPMVTGSNRAIYVYHDLEFESQLKPEFQEPMFGSAGPACIFNRACLPH